MNAPSKSSRVDIQISVLTTVLIICSIVCVVVFQYMVNYRETTAGFSANAEKIYDYFDDAINTRYQSTLTVEDIYSDLSPEAQNIKKYSGVKDIYFAVHGENNTFVRCENKEIPITVSDELSDMLNRSYTGSIILPNKLIKTKDSHIFAALYPVYGSQGVLAVLTVEFDGSLQYTSFLSVLIGTILIGVASCLLAILIAFFKFKRLANPNYQDMANTDYLSQMKNRNAFDTDMFNISNGKNFSCVGLICIDLNGLKSVNDTYGHAVGDNYIKAAALAIKKSIGKNQTAYRIGGDEFVVMLLNADSSSAEQVTENILTNIEDESLTSTVRPSVAMGYAVFDKASDQSIYDTFKRADKNMYKNKKKSKNPF